MAQRPHRAARFVRRHDRRREGQRHPRVVYTHPRDGHDLGASDQAATGWNGTVDGYNPDWSVFDRPEWNDFINDIDADLIDRYGSRIDGLFIDEGSGAGDSWRVVDYPRLRRTIKNRQSDLLMMQNYYGTNYRCDIGATEISYWGLWVPGSDPDTIYNTYPSQSWVIPPNATINGLTAGIVATGSAEDGSKFIHVPSPPAGNSLAIPSPADGRAYISARLLDSGNAVALVRNADASLTLTLQHTDTWNALDTATASVVSIRFMAARIPSTMGKVQEIWGFVHCKPIVSQACCNPSPFPALSR